MIGKHLDCVYLVIFTSLKQYRTIHKQLNDCRQVLDTGNNMEKEGKFPHTAVAVGKSNIFFKNDLASVRQIFFNFIKQTPKT